MLPVLLTLNCPLRVYWIWLPWSWVWKKPLPLIARSSGLPVGVMLPWLNCCATAATCTPMPACVLFEAEPVIAAAYMSANSARDDFSPYVLELATLLPITSRFFDAALKPDRPCWKLMEFSWGKSVGSVEGADVGVVDATAVVELDGELAVRAADRIDAVEGEGSRFERRLVVERVDAERERLALGRDGHVEVEAVAADALGPHLDGAHGRAGRVEDVDADAGGRASELEAAVALVALGVDAQRVAVGGHVVAHERGALHRLQLRELVVEAADRLVEGLHALHGADLRHLARDLGRVHRIQRILVGHLRHQQLQEAVGLVFGGGGAPQARSVDAGGGGLARLGGRLRAGGGRGGAEAAEVVERRV